MLSLKTVSYLSLTVYRTCTSGVWCLGMLYGIMFSTFLLLSRVLPTDSSWTSLKWMYVRNVSLKHLLYGFSFLCLQTYFTASFLWDFVSSFLIFPSFFLLSFHIVSVGLFAFALLMFFSSFNMGIIFCVVDFFFFLNFCLFINDNKTKKKK